MQSHQSLLDVGAGPQLLGRSDGNLDFPAANPLHCCDLLQVFQLGEVGNLIAGNTAFDQLLNDILV